MALSYCSILLVSSVQINISMKYSVVQYGLFLAGKYVLLCNIAYLMRAIICSVKYRMASLHHANLCYSYCAVWLISCVQIYGVFFCCFFKYAMVQYITCL